MGNGSTAFGIGQGLSSFADAFTKARDVSTRRQQADTQQYQAETERENRKKLAKLQTYKDYADSISKIGGEAAQAVFKGLIVPDEEDDGNPNTIKQSDAENIRNTIESKKGLVSDPGQAPIGQPPAQGQGLVPKGLVPQQPAQPQPQQIGQPQSRVSDPIKNVLSERELAQRSEADAAQKQGQSTGQAYKTDSRGVLVRDASGKLIPVRVPLSPQAQKESEMQFHKSLSDNDAVSAAQKAALNFSTIKSAAVDPSPTKDTALILEYANLQSGGRGADVHSLEELRKSKAGGKIQGWANALEQSRTGMFDEDTRNQLIRSAADLTKGRVSMAKAVINSKATGDARKQYNLGNFATAFPDIDKADQMASEVLASMPGYKPKGLIRQVGGLVKEAVGMGGAGSTQASSLSPEDRKTLETALKNNPNDPRAGAIRKLLGQ